MVRCETSLRMAQGCARINSKLDTAKIGSAGRLEVRRVACSYRGTKNVSTRPGSKADLFPKSGLRTDVAPCPSHLFVFLRGQRLDFRDRFRAAG